MTTTALPLSPLAVVPCPGDLSDLHVHGSEGSRQGPSPRLALVAPAARAQRPAPLAHGAAAPVRRPSGARRPGGITRRGRVVLFVLGALVLACMFVLGRSSSSVAAETSPAPTVVVGPGQTLWSIAEQVAPQADPRSTVDRLAALNHLGATDPLVPGQVLTLPRR